MSFIMKVFYSILLVYIMSSCQLKSHNPLDYPTRSSEELAKNLLESFYDSISDTINYPPYYGGMYVDRQNNHFVIYVIGDTLVAKDDLLKHCNGKGFVIYQSQVSLSNLMDLVKKLEMYIYDPLGKKVKLYGIYLDEIHNNVHVILGDTTSQNIAQFRTQIMDSPYLVFEQGEGLNVDMEFKRIK